MVLVARDALTDRLVRVRAEARPKIGQNADEVLYAVFADRNLKHFLGLVSAKEIAAKPQRIFADLLPRQALEPVAEDTPLDQVFRHMEQEGLWYLPVVDSGGCFLGAVTRFGIVKALFAENRRLILRLFTLQEQERRFLYRELHDELGQYLTALRADLERLSFSLRGEAKLEVEAIGRVVEHLCLTLKKVMSGLYPMVLDQLGLVEGLYELVEEYRRHHPQVRFELKADGDFKDLDEEYALCLYRVAQEALTNAVRHAKARQINLCLCRFPQGPKNSCRGYFPCPSQPAVYLSIRDDGQGLAANLKGGFGLISMRERVQALGGTLKLDSRPKQGVTVTVGLPLP